MLRINLLDVSHDAVPEQPSRLIWLVALLVVLLSASIGAAGYVGLKQQRDTLTETLAISEERRTEVRTELQSQRERVAALSALQATLNDSTALLEQPNTNYGALAHALESLDANDEDLPLLVQAMVANNELHLTAIAEDARQLREWYARNAQHEGLEELTITSMRIEEITDRRDDEATIRFSAWARLDATTSGEEQ